MDFYSLTAQLNSIHNAKSYEPQNKYESKDRRVRAAVPLLKVIKEHPGITPDKIVELTNYFYRRAQENLKYLRDNGYAKGEVILGAPGKRCRWYITPSGNRFLSNNQ